MKQLRDTYETIEYDTGYRPAEAGSEDKGAIVKHAHTCIVVGVYTFVWHMS